MTTTASSPAAAIAENIQRAWGTFLERGSRPQSPHASIYASAWRVCDRRMALELTQPETLPPWPVEALARFRRGDDRERDLLADLSRIGRDAEPRFSLIGQQERFTLKDHKGRVAISGKVDARLDLGDAGKPPLEVKAWHPNLVERIETFADLFENPWTIGGAHQLLSYLFGAGEPFGFLLLDRSGIPRLLPVELDANLERMEAFLVKAERVLDAVASGVLPPYLEGEPDECLRCPWYGAVCNPPLDAPAATILTDPALEAALERREEIGKIGREYCALDREVKDRLRGITSGIAGKFVIKGRWGKQSHLELPAALKAKYTTTDPHGRFTLEITKLG